MNRENDIAKLSQQHHLIKKYQVKTISLFGSLARDEAGPGSDIDLLVEFEPTAGVGLFEFARLRRELSQLLGCEIDLATPDSLRKTMKSEIMKEAIRAA